MHSFCSSTHQIPLCILGYENGCVSPKRLPSFHNMTVSFYEREVASFLTLSSLNIIRTPMILVIEISGAARLRHGLLRPVSAALGGHTGGELFQTSRPRGNWNFATIDTKSGTAIKRQSSMSPLQIPHDAPNYDNNPTPIPIPCSCRWLTPPNHTLPYRISTL